MDDLGNESNSTINEMAEVNRLHTPVYVPFNRLFGNSAKHMYNLW